MLLGRCLLQRLAAEFSKSTMWFKVFKVFRVFKVYHVFQDFLGSIKDVNMKEIIAKESLEYQVSL